MIQPAPKIMQPCVSGSTGNRLPAALPATYAVLALAGLVAWGYWTTFVEMVERWYSDPQYNHGFLVPFFSAWLLWLRRDQFPGLSTSFNWSGTLLILAGAALRLTGAYFFYH